MFRVPLDTVLVRASATGLVALTAFLASCGSDASSPGQAAVPATGAAPAASTAGTTPPVELDPAIKEAAKKEQAVQEDKTLSDAEKAKRQTAIAKEAVSSNLPKVTDTPESDATIAAASAKKKTKSSLQDDVDKAKAALDKAGLKATKVQMSGAVGAAVQVENTTIVFYSSAKKAAKNAETFALAIAANPDFGRISRKNNRVYLLSVASKITSQDEASYDAVRKAVNAGY